MKQRLYTPRTTTSGKQRRPSDATGRKALHKTPWTELGPVCGASLEVLEARLNKIKP